jgi:hypothetical protein
MLAILNFSAEVVEYRVPDTVKLGSAEIMTETGCVELKDGTVSLKGYSGSLFRCTM